MSKNKKTIKNFHLKITIFTAVKYCSILHGHVCVMTIFSCLEDVKDAALNIKDRCVYSPGVIRKLGLGRMKVGTGET